MWKSIPGFDGYEASDDGQIRSVDRVIVRARKEGMRSYNMKGRILKQMWSGGYWCVTMGTDRYSSGRYQRPEAVHRLVCLAFKGEPKPGQIALHFDDNRHNNKEQNVRWGSHTDNRHDSYRNERNPFVIAGQKRQKQIKKMLDEGVPQFVVAERFGVSRSLVSQVKNGKTKI